MAQRCVGGQSSHNMARIAGYCAGIGALEWAREGRLRVPGALRGALCALLATWCVLVKDDMAWVICAACCRGAHSRFEREASVGCRGLRCVWCVCGARASSRRRGLKRWGRVCGRHATHKYLSLRRLFVGVVVRAERVCAFHAREDIQSLHTHTRTKKGQRSSRFNTRNHASFETQ